MQVAAWYRGRKTTSDRQTTTSNGDFRLLRTESVMRDGSERTVWTWTSTGKDSDVIFSTVGHFCAIVRVCTGPWLPSANRLDWSRECVWTVSRSKCVTVPNFVAIGQTVADIWRVIDFPRWRSSAILDLWCVCSDHPQRSFGGLYHCAKFGWNPSNCC